MDAQASLLYKNARPDVINKLFLWDDFAGALRQIYKNVERPAAERERNAIAAQDPLSARQLKRTELEFPVNLTSGHSLCSQRRRRVIALLRKWNSMLAAY